MQKLKELLESKPEIISLLILVLIIAVYLGPFLCPSIREVFLLLPKVSQLQAKIVKIEKDWANIDSLERNISQVNEKIDYYEKKLPSKKEVPVLLEYLSEAAKKLNVRITEIKPIKQNEVGKQIYSSEPILVKAECGYHQLGRFLNELESADRFMKISNIEIKAGASGSNIHKVQLIVVTYVMKR